MLDLSDPERQVAYYDPRVGTFSAKGAWTRASQRLTKALGLSPHTKPKSPAGHS
jgi:hypothetical protein